MIYARTFSPLNLYTKLTPHCTTVRHGASRHCDGTSRGKSRFTEHGVYFVSNLKKEKTKEHTQLTSPVQETDIWPCSYDCR